jgi:ParB/RepB/Spo0J family partition protein
VKAFKSKISTGIGSVKSSDVLKEIPISYITVDPEQPRKLELTPDDIQNAEMHVGRKLSEKQEAELNSIIDLSETIKSVGLIQPITVIEDSTKTNRFTIVHGERRYLAAVFAKQSKIRAIIVKDKDDLLQRQVVENTGRRGMSLSDTLSAIRSLIADYSITTGAQLSKVSGFSISQASEYLKLNREASPTLLADISTGKIKSLSAALTQIKSENADDAPEEVPVSGKRAGRPSIQIKLSTKNVKVGGALLTALSTQFKIDLEGVDMDSVDSINTAVGMILKHLETTIGE